MNRDPKNYGRELLGTVTQADKATELLRWAVEWIEYAGAVPFEGDDHVMPEEPHYEKYLAAKELLK